MPLNNDPFALSNDGYLIIQTSPVDDGQQIQQLDGPQPYVDALFKLNDHYIDLIEADNGYAFDADTARTELEQLEYGEDFEASIGDRSYFLTVAEEALDEEQGYGYGMSI
jgi:hypothetical protein